MAKKHMIIRGLWGEIDGWKAKSDIVNAKRRDGDLDFVCYTFGEKNHNNLLEAGVNSVLLDTRPHVYPFHFRHKLDIYKAAMEEYDEIVFFDWDCNLKEGKSFDSDAFWKSVRSKDVVQCTLYRWKRAVCQWRDKRHDQSYIMNSSFFYMRDKSLPATLTSKYDTLPNKKWWRGNDETVTSYCIDELMGGWKGEDYWMEHFESELYYQGCNPVFKKKPNAMFNHFFKSWKK